MRPRRHWPLPLLLGLAVGLLGCGGNKRAPGRADAASGAGGAGGAGGAAPVAGGGSGGGGSGGDQAGQGGAGQGGAGEGGAGQGGAGGDPPGAGGAGGEPALDAADAPVTMDSPVDLGSDLGTDVGTDLGIQVPVDVLPLDTGTDATDAFSTDAGTCGGVRCPRLFMLVEACRPTGSCVRSTSPGSLLNENRCYANGVKVFSVSNLTAFPPFQTLSWTYPDGSPCYSLEAAPQIIGGGLNLTWKSPTIPVIARGTADAMGNITIICDGATEPLTDPNCAPQLSATGCTLGVCQ